MARMSLDTRRRVIYWHQKGYTLKGIQLRLKDEDITVSKRSLCLLIKKYRLHETILDLPRPVPPTKLSLEHLQMIDSKLEEDDETSAAELQRILHDTGIRVSASTIQRAKMKLG